MWNDAYVSVQRLDAYFSLPVIDMDRDGGKQTNNSKHALVQFENASFSWTSLTSGSIAVIDIPSTSEVQGETLSLTEATAQAEEHEIGFMLKDISVSMHAGELIAVVGSVGSGKSSLLSTILGEMPVTTSSSTPQDKLVTTWPH